MSAKSAAEGELEVERDRVGVVVLHPDPLEQPAVDGADPPDVQRLLRHGDLVALVQVGVREVDVRHVRALRRGREQHRVAPGDGHPELREVSRVAVVQPEAVVAAVIEVALEVAVEEGLALLDREGLAGEVGDEDRRAGLRRVALRLLLRVGIGRHGMVATGAGRRPCGPFESRVGVIRMQ